MSKVETVLITGATGYIGGRLAAALVETARPLRLLVRDPARIPYSLGSACQVARGDLLDQASLRTALADVSAAYYLVHSMGAAGRFEERDREAATNFAEVAREAGVRRIIYLGGLGRGDALSSHLASRQEAGSILRASGVPTIEFRAAVILGAGSISFDMVRALVESLPVMIVPHWVSTLTQPIAVDDVISYLISALDLPLTESAIFEIGGSDRVSYLDLMREYGRQRGLRRVFLRVPVLTPRLSSLWLGLVTPLQARVGRRLIEGVRNETVVTDSAARDVFRITPRGIGEAISNALAEEEARFAATRWNEVFPAPRRQGEWCRQKTGGRLILSTATAAFGSSSDAFDAVIGVVGRSLWYLTGWAVGVRRKRMEARPTPTPCGPVALARGQRVGPWRVELAEAGRLLRLSFALRMPGKAWMQLEVAPANQVPGHIIVRQTGLFEPRGLLGILCWYVTYPLHRVGMAAGLRHILCCARRKGDQDGRPGACPGTRER